ncbi:MAG: UDP-N-acetylglucosamine 2-epimerase (non-hydrolyzing) [Kiritimatiellia bacterium]|nr:UDP-N-acetylglucosamine 2-epimerase (non-hydrolyzing) [Kiritimatiellia bacterium]
MKTIALLAGARPNYMKVFPIRRELSRRADRFRSVLIHTGQHYDPLMNDVFFQDFEMAPPEVFLGVGSGSHGAQTGKVMIALEEALVKDRPDVLLVVGDINSTVAGALVGTKMGIRVVHLEAGLRSGDRTMPEEINRLATDAISDLLLTPSPDADENLRREGVPESRIRCVGNIMIDSLVSILPKTLTSDVLKRLNLEKERYALVTLHRPSNVDDPERLALLLKQLAELARKMKVLIPLHPRTRKLIDASPELGKALSALQCIEPLGYIDFLRLQTQAAVVVTDSGGIQEETSYLGIPCLTVRPNTERPVTVELGTNRLVNPEVTNLKDEVEAAMVRWAGKAAPEIPLWEGKTAARVVEAVAEI